MPNTCFKLSHAQIIQETFDDEVVIVDLSQGTYFSLAGAGSEIWSAALHGAPRVKIVAQLQQRNEGDAAKIESATLQFLQQLQDEGLLAVADNNEIEYSNGVSQPVERKMFVAPQLQKFSDMQALLMLDPIHEVDEAGWPNVKAIAEKSPVA